MRTWKFTALALAALVLHGIPTPVFATESTSEATADHPADSKALLIDIDGVRWDKLQEADTPNLDALADEGQLGPTQTHDTSVARTDSGPGHSNILTGVWPDKHGVVDNTFKGNRIADYPDLLTRAEGLRPELSTFSILDWEPLNKYVIDKPDLKLQQPTAGGAIASDSRTAGTVSNLISYDDPDLGYVYFHEPDERGHALGSESREYVDAIERVDAHVGEIVDAVQDRESYDREDWMFVLTTDHGFDGNVHGTDAPTVRQIWSLTSGGDVPAEGLVDEGRPQVSVLPTIFRHLGLPGD